MVTFAFALAIGAVVAVLGLLLAPRENVARPTRVLRIGVAAAMPGVVLGLLLAEDLWLDTHAASLATSVVGSTLAVLGAAFLPKDKALDVGKFEALGPPPSGANVTVAEAATLSPSATEPGFTDCLAYMWRLKACRRVPGFVRSSTANATL